MQLKTAEESKYFGVEEWSTLLLGMGISIGRKGEGRSLSRHRRPITERPALLTRLNATSRNVAAAFNYRRKYCNSGTNVQNRGPAS